MFPEDGSPKFQFQLQASSELSAKKTVSLEFVIISGNACKLAKGLLSTTTWSVIMLLLLPVGPNEVRETV